MADAEIRKEAAGEKTPLLQVDHLKTHFDVTKGLFSPKQIVKAVDDVSFYVGEGETYGLVGESGCGKSTLGRTLVKIYPATGGKVLYKGQDIARLGKEEEKHFRKEVQMIFQDPMASLNERAKVEYIVAEGLLNHHLYKDQNDLHEKVMDALHEVGLLPEFASRFPHEFSGGQRQRIAIARAMALDPDVIVCDEAVSALDVLVQDQVLRLLNDLQAEKGLSYLFITHDLAVVRQIADEVVVMQHGKLVEHATTDEVFDHPQKQYTRDLLDAIPGGKLQLGLD